MGRGDGDLSLGYDPMETFVIVFRSKLHVEVSALLCRLKRGLDFQDIVGEYNLFPTFGGLTTRAKNRSRLRAPTPNATVVIIFERCDSTGDFAKPKSLL